MAVFDISKQSIMLISCPDNKGLNSNDTSDTISCFIKNAENSRLFGWKKSPGFPLLFGEKNPV